ncbi:MAG: 16S rRNA (guanine(527)-N(7))-methyltransferase RsmG [Thermoflavifilum sp.]|nr:16S rRNA (guanine(527)-N(7))-methyltransferase RsmG [Thermoflavifilum sp.]
MAKPHIEEQLQLIISFFPQLSDTQIQQLQALYDLYHFWNQRINVISRKDLDGLYERHVLHSLSIALFYRFTAHQYIVDIGTGGGFPGIPLAILFPETHFLLIDAIGKKIRVVQDVIHQIKLTQVEAKHMRAEQLPAHRFHFALSRAVAPLNQLWKWAKPTLLPASGNGLICLKGGDITQEVEACGCHPHIHLLHSAIKRDYFQEKYVLFVPISH